MPRQGNSIAGRLVLVVGRWHILAPLVFIAANAAMLMGSRRAIVVLHHRRRRLAVRQWLRMAYALVGTTIGAAEIFIVAKGGLRGLTERAGPLAGRIAKGFRTNALSYLIFLRLVPVFR